MKREEFTIPPCPACGGDQATHTPPDKANLGRFQCWECWTFYNGTTEEWEKYEEHRKRRQEAVGD